MDMTTEVGTRRDVLPRRTLLARGGVALVLSLGVNWLLLWTVLAVDLVEPFDPLSYPPVTLLTTAGVIGATIVYAVLDRRFDNPDRIFVRLAGVVLVLSFLPDIALLVFDEAATVGAVVVLAGLHVPVAVICVLVLTGRWSRLLA